MDSIPKESFDLFPENPGIPRRGLTMAEIADAIRPVPELRAVARRRIERRAPKECVTKRHDDGSYIPKRIRKR